MSVSVIIPNFNNSIWLERCVESCINQLNLLEIIIVDDGSTDDSLEVLNKIRKQHPLVVKLFKNPGKGANRARDFGFQQSSGKYIQWLDSDDFLLPGKLEKQVKILESEGSDVVYSDFRLDYYEDGVFVKEELKKVRSFPDFIEEIINDNWIACHSYLITRKMAERLAGDFGWSYRTKVGQDREYFTKAAILGAKFNYVPGIYAVYNRWSINSISKQKFDVILEETHRLGREFKLLVKRSSLFSKKEKKKYISIINTQELKRCYYQPKLGISNLINPATIRWNQIHYKMRLVIPLVYLYQHTRFCLTKKV